jgi:hypothetical protein
MLIFKSISHSTAEHVTIAELTLNSNHSPNLFFDSLKNITEYTVFTIKKDINIYI